MDEIELGTYLKRFCGQTLEVSEDMADQNQDRLMRKMGCRNCLADAQLRDRWWHLLKEAKAQDCRADDDDDDDDDDDGGGGGGGGGVKEN